MPIKDQGYDYILSIKGLDWLTIFFPNSLISWEKDTRNLPTISIVFVYLYLLYIMLTIIDKMMTPLLR